MEKISRRKALAIVPAAMVTVPALAGEQDPHPQWLKEWRAAERAHNDAHDIAHERHTRALAGFPEWKNPPRLHLHIGIPEDMPEHLLRLSPLRDEYAGSVESIECMRRMWRALLNTEPEEMRAPYLKRANDHYDNAVMDFAEREAAQNREREAYYRRREMLLNASGYRTAEDEAERIYQEMCKLSDLVMNTPAQTVAGVAAQVTLYAETYLDDSDSKDPLNGIAQQLERLAGAS